MIFMFLSGLITASILAVGGGFLASCQYLNGLGVKQEERLFQGFSCLILGVIGMLLFSASACDYAISKERGRAVEAGVAHYVADDKTGEVSFEYIQLGDEIR